MYAEKSKICLSVEEESHPNVFHFTATMKKTIDLTVDFLRCSLHFRHDDLVRVVIINTPCCPYFVSNNCEKSTLLVLMNSVLSFPHDKRKSEMPSICYGL